MKCIYCNSSDLTISDIIPYALTGAKVKKGFVCAEHNKYTNDHFEKQTISEFDFFRNALGLTTRDGNLVKFNANLQIDDLIISNTSISNRASIYATNRLFPTEKDGKKVLFGNIDLLKKIKGATPDVVDIKDLMVTYKFNLNNLFALPTTLHTIAKIAYEWHCYNNEICEYKEEYKEITQYVLEKESNDEIVEIVIDGNVLNVFEQLSDLGTNSVYEYLDVDGFLYVVFSLWNVIAYKVRIYKPQNASTEKASMYYLFQYCIDGTKRNTCFGVYGNPHVISELPSKAIIRLKKFFIDKLDALTKTRVLSIYLVNKLITLLQEDLHLFKNNKIDFAKLLDYEDNDRLIAMRLVKFCSENESYDVNKSFNDNIRGYFNIDETLSIQENEKMNLLREFITLNETDELVSLLDRGIAKFRDIWDNEMVQLEN